MVTNPQIIKNIIAWHPVLSDDQVSIYEEICKESDATVIVNVTQTTDAYREKQGWSGDNLTRVKKSLIPDGQFVNYCLKALFANRGCIHIFGSVFQDLRLYFILVVALKLGIESYIVSEPYAPVAVNYFGRDRPYIDSAKSYLRPLLYKVYVSVIKCQLAGVFAISKLAVDQFESAGVPRKKIYPFGYFVHARGCEHKVHVSGTHLRPLKVVFVGSLIPRKDLPTLIRGVKIAIEGGIDVTLDVYGPGDPSQFMFDDNRVRYRGLLPFGKAQDFLVQYDVLSLPSRFDGWGIVVNEALLSGIPVICSDRVGAKVLIEKFGCGLVFPCGDHVALADCFSRLANQKGLYDKLTSAVFSATKIIDPSRAASLMLEIFSARSDERSSINSPWY